MRQIYDLETDLYQACGSLLYRLLPSTSASRVFLADGASVETRLNLLERGLAGNTTTRMADTIAQRDAIAHVIAGDRCYVFDASADPAVAEGGAMYMWVPGSGWVCIYCAAAPVDVASLIGFGLTADARGRLAVDFARLPASQADAIVAERLGSGFTARGNVWNVDFTAMPADVFQSLLAPLVGAGLEFTGGQLAAKGLDAGQVMAIVLAMAGEGLWAGEKSLAVDVPGLDMGALTAGQLGTMAARLFSPAGGLGQGADGLLRLDVASMGLANKNAVLAEIAGSGLIVDSGRIDVDFGALPAGLVENILYAMLATGGPLAINDSGRIYARISDATDSENSTICASSRAVSLVAGQTALAGANARLALENAAAASQAAQVAKTDAGAAAQLARAGVDAAGVAQKAADNALAGLADAEGRLTGLEARVPEPSSGEAAKYLRGDGSWQTPPDTTYGAATQAANGLMTAADKKKLDGIAAGAQVNDANALISLADYYSTENAATGNTVTNGVFLMHSTKLGISGENAFFYVIQLFFSSVGAASNRVQIAFKYSGGNACYIRNYVGNAWSAWSKLLNCSGDTMTGRLTFAATSSASIVLQSADLIYNEASASNQYRTISFTDKNGAAMGYVRCLKRTDGSTEMQLVARNRNAANTGDIEPALVAKAHMDGTMEILCNSPADAANANHVATTRWTRDRIAAATGKGATTFSLMRAAASRLDDLGLYLELALECVNDACQLELYAGFVWEHGGEEYFFDCDLFAQQNLNAMGVLALANARNPEAAVYAHCRNMAGERLRLELAPADALDLFAHFRQNHVEPLLEACRLKKSRLEALGDCGEIVDLLALWGMDGQFKELLAGRRVGED